MFPILLKIPILGGIPIHGYGVMVALGFIVGSWYIKREAIRVGIDPNRAMDLIFYILIAALLGSRVLYVFTAEWDRFVANPLNLFKIWEGGLVFYGGFLGSLAVSSWYFRRHKLPVWKWCDLFIPAVALGHSFGRLGCFLAGCCYGRPLLENSWFAITFPDHVQSWAPPNVPLYPTQLMESAAEFLTFLLLVSFRKKKKFEGELFAGYLLIYAIVRGVIETFRGDLDRGTVLVSWLSTSQFISVIMFAVGLFVFLRNRRKFPVTLLPAALLAILTLFQSGCAKPAFHARTQEPKYYGRVYTATEEEAFSVAKFVLKTSGYPIDSEDAKEKPAVSRWVPVGADSHAVLLFGRRDYGATGSYRQLEIHVAPASGDENMEGKVHIEVGSRVQSLVARIRSTGEQEKLILDRISDTLRPANAVVTNTGLQE